MRRKYISPSILDVKQEDRAQFTRDLIQKGIKWIHFDVMDGIFVPNKAISLEDLQSIKENTNELKYNSDVHLMVDNPLDVIDEYSKLVSIVTFHYEAVPPLDIALFLDRYSHDYNLGLAINPDTSVEEIEPFLQYFDLILVMSVYPGKGGQKFMPIALDKIKELKRLRDLRSAEMKYSYLIQVDGGINQETAKLVWKAGADLVVAGSYIVNNPTVDNINSISYEKRLK